MTEGHDIKRKKEEKNEDDKMETSAGGYSLCTHGAAGKYSDGITGSRCTDKRNKGR